MARSPQDGRARVGRLDFALSGLAFVWSGAATTYLLAVAAKDGVGTGTAIATGDVQDQPLFVSLASGNGPWIVLLLVGMTILSGLPIGVSLSHPETRRLTNWVVGILLLFFSAVSAFSVGPYFLPSALLLLAAGSLAGVPVATKGASEHSSVE